MHGGGGEEVAGEGLKPENRGKMLYYDDDDDDYDEDAGFFKRILAFCFGCTVQSRV